MVDFTSNTKRRLVINEVIGVLLELAKIYFTVDVHTRIVNPESELLPSPTAGSGRGYLWEARKEDKR